MTSELDLAKTRISLSATKLWIRYYRTRIKKKQLSSNSEQDVNLHQYPLTPVGSHDSTKEIIDKLKDRLKAAEQIPHDLLIKRLLRNRKKLLRKVKSESKRLQSPPYLQLNVYCW